MAGKRRKKSAATEVTAPPNEALIRGELSTSPKVEPAREVETAAGKKAALASAGSMPTARGDVTTTPGKLDGTTEAKARVSAVAVQDREQVQDRQQQIREHAYHLWKHAGEPHGEHDEHWSRAEKLLEKS